MMPDHSLLSAWHDFYVIIGSGAAALIGLQFVVMALIADMRSETSHATVSAFGTPTVVYFTGGLLIAAVMTAPWPTLIGTSIALLLCAIVGFIYAIAVTRRTHRQTEYKPVAEDWLWFVIVPCILFSVLAVAALVLPTHAEPTLFVVAAVALSLLLVGIRNSWDTVLYLVTGGPASPPEQPQVHEPES